eukprot:scaffold76693_cov73-Phaeocystis_antarctica.AAC.2
MRSRSAGTPQAVGNRVLEGPPPSRLRRAVPQPGANEGPRGDSRPPHNSHSQPSSGNPPATTPLTDNPEGRILRGGPQSVNVNSAETRTVRRREKC